MTSRKVFHCIADDTVLITNISEIKKWVSNGSIILTLPIHTLERLALLKQDAAQIGINARKTVDFLDGVTEGRDGVPVSAISLQGPTEQYQKWAEVEKYIVSREEQAEKATESPTQEMDKNPQPESRISEEDISSTQPVQGTTNVLSRMLLSKLNFAQEPDLTPPASPGSSLDKSVKNSPEAMVARPEEQSIIVPHSLKPLVNAVVWQANRAGPASKAPTDLYFISNSGDTAALMRSFGVRTKNIHQLRQAVGLEDQELKNQSKYLEKHPSPPTRPVVMANVEPQSMFKYEEESDEELVFKPRGRGTKLWQTPSTSSSPIMHASAPVVRPASSHRHSARSSVGHPNRPGKPEVPTEEIDPNSFDRGSFAPESSHRSALAEGNISNGTKPRGHFLRGSLPPPGPSRGFYRGSPRGSDRGSVRGRGRLYVP